MTDIAKLLDEAKRYSRTDPGAGLLCVVAAVEEVCRRLELKELAAAKALETAARTNLEGTDGRQNES